MCGEDGARGGCGAKLVGCGWVGVGSVVVLGKLWVGAGLCVGEERSLGAASLAVNSVSSKPALEGSTKQTIMRISRKW